jgi:uncharacterized protein
VAVVASSLEPVLPPGAAFIVPVRPGVRPADPDLEMGRRAPDQGEAGPSSPQSLSDGGWVAKSRRPDAAADRKQRSRRQPRAGTRSWLALGATTIFVLGLVGLTTLLRGTAPSVVDEAALLDPPARGQIADYHRRLLESFDIDYRVVTAAATGGLDSYGERTFDRLGVGRASLAGRGLLLVIEPASGQVRLEASAQLEGMFDAGFIAYLEQRQMAPFFEQARVADGILATSELILARAQQAASGFAFDLGVAETFDVAGGAVGAPHTGDFLPGGTPSETLDAYLAALEARRAGPDLALYSRETQAMRPPPALTPAQMAQVARSHRACGGRETWIGGPDNARAVIRYAPEQRQCAPWFLVREDGAWRLDLAAGQRALAFDEQRHWRLAEREAAGYGFGFTDWRFDDQGVPIISS